MRVLVCHRPPGAFSFISDGWVNALASVGHAVARWDGSPNSWRDFKPDLYIGCSGHKQPIPERRDDCLVAIHVNPRGDLSVPGIDESPENVAWTLAQKPDAVFGYGHQDDAHLWGHWPSRHGVQWVPMATAADVTLFNSEPGPKSCGLVYVGGRWPYKAQSIDKWLLPVLHSPGLDYRLHGWGDWSMVRSSPIEDAAVPGLLASGRVGPCIAEPHTNRLGFDLPERVFKVAASGTVAVHDSVPGLERFLPSVQSASCPEHFKSLCLHYAGASDSVTSPLARKQRYEVLGAHTYHHRVAGLLAALGFNSAASEMQTYVKGLL